MRIADRAVLVTGANRGIGQALVEEALKRGAKRVYAGTRQPLAHPDERVTALTSTYRRPRRSPSREPSSAEWRTGRRTSSPIPCHSPWRTAGAAVRAKAFERQLSALVAAEPVKA